MQNYAIIFKYYTKEQSYCIFIERKVKKCGDYVLCSTFFVVSEIILNFAPRNLKSQR